MKRTAARTRPPATDWAAAAVALASAAFAASAAGELALAVALREGALLASLSPADLALIGLLALWASGALLLAVLTALGRPVLAVRLRAAWSAARARLERRAPWSAALAGLLLAGAWVVLFRRTGYGPVWLAAARFGAGHAALLAGLLWAAARPGRRALWSTAGALLVMGVVLRGMAYLPEIRTSPFSLGWSEASRYYYASLFQAERLYGQALPLPHLHPTRYLMQSLPFLLPALPIWAHRLWQVLLWVGMSGLAGHALARRFRLRGALAWGIAAWSFLFLLQGPVYYHLLVCVISPLWWVDTRRPLRTLLVVLLVSLWAGISRINWYPAPGLIAALLYLLETPQAGRPVLRYAAWPLAWTALGTAAAFAAQETYVRLSGSPPGEFGSSFTSDLLWYRLLPNLTYPPGILIAGLAVALPLGLAVGWQLLRAARALSAWRWLGILTILGVMFAGGLVVSVKIGGGSNLHNLDASLALLWLAGAALALGRFATEPGIEPGRVGAAPAWILALVIAVPAITAFRPVVYGAALPPSVAAANLAHIQQAIDAAGGQQAEILFIGERQLIPFRLVHDVSLEDRYERVFLMEMAMANNRPYLERFAADMAGQRYAVIIAEPMQLTRQGRSHAFGEENDVWVERVAAPLLEHYTVQTRLEGIEAAIYVPKP